jgi:hypothetical protein
MPSEEDLHEKLLPDAGDFQPAKPNASEPPLTVAISVGLIITGISVLFVFRGATLGYFFLLSGVAVFIVGLFLKAEKEKTRKTGQGT